MQFGRRVEELEVGAVCMHRPGTTVTEYGDHLLRLILVNHHPLHLESAYAATTHQQRTGGELPGRLTLQV